MNLIGTARFSAAVLIALGFFGISGCDGLRQLDLAGDEQRLMSALTMPKEDVYKDKAFLHQMRQKRVKTYVSLTTSPKRIQYLSFVFRSLDLGQIESILLILPETFERDGSKYVIPEEIRDFPKVNIIRIREDRGPLSKLIGAFELGNIYEGREVAEEVLKNPNNRVITVDDDIGYPNGTIGQLIHKSIMSDEPAVFAASAGELSFWKLDRNSGWPNAANENASHCGSGEVSLCDVVEGFGGVVYRVRDVQESLSDLLRYGEKKKGNMDCFASDDLVISYVLAKHKVKRFRLANKFIRAPLPYSYGLLEDALHRGAGLYKEATSHDDNAAKYGKCFEILRGRENK